MNAHASFNQRFIRPLVFLLVLISFAGCEKDIYEDGIQQEMNASKKRMITIDQAPNLRPIVEKYQRLRQMRNRSVDSLDLDLDLEHIVEVDKDGKITYSIAIQKYAEDYERYYFENLHVYEEGGEVKSMIFHYEPENEYAKMEFDKFTGKVDIYDLEYNHQALMAFETGKLQCMKLDLGCWHLVWFSNGNGGVSNDCEGGGGSGDSTPDTGGSDGDGGNYSGGNYNGGSGSGGSYSGGTTPGVNDPTTTPHNSSEIAPNVPQLPLTCTFNMKVKLICQSAELNEEQKNFLSENSIVTAQIYQYLLVNGNDAQARDFITAAMPSIMEGDEIDYPDNIIYALSQKPCQKQVVKDIVNQCSNFSNLMFQTFDTDDSANVKFWIGPPSNVYNANTNPIYEGTPNHFIIKIEFAGNFLDESTDLGIAADALHELAHAYMINLYLKGQLVAANANFSTLLNAFVAFYANKNSQTGQTLEDASHNAMGTFVQKMAESLYNFALSKGINASPDDCLAIMWGTLNGTPAFDTLTPSQQTDYANAISKEENDLPGKKGTACQ